MHFSLDKQRHIFPEQLKQADFQLLQYFLKYNSPLKKYY